MSVAQKIYEKGKITYMRTDSPGLSVEAMTMIKDQVINQFGENYYYARNKTIKVKGAQEAHECIRPTDFKTMILNPDFDIPERKLYSLIWKRTMASQMAAMVYDVLTFKVGIRTDPKTEHFKSEFKSLKFSGFNILYTKTHESEISSEILEKITKGRKVDLRDTAGQ